MIQIADINPLTLPFVLLEQRSQLPTAPCIYFAIDSARVVQYIGRSVNPCQRWTQHHRQQQLEQMGSVRLAWFECSDTSLLAEIEQALIEWFKPPMNGSAVATDKRKVSAYLSDDLKTDADKLAKLEHRSLSNLIEVLLHKAVDKAREEGKL